MDRYEVYVEWLDCVVPENIHTHSPKEGIFPKTPHPSENSNKASYISLTVLAFETPPPPGISNPFRGGSMHIELLFGIRLKFDVIYLLRKSIFPWQS